MDKKIISFVLLGYGGCNLGYAIGGATNYHLSSLKDNKYVLEDYRSGVIINPSTKPLPTTKEFKAHLIGTTTGTNHSSVAITFVA